jgi:hypothetical protein
MNNAVDEDSVPIENPDFWYTEFITKDGISKLSSQIDIAAGGDQAYLSSSSVKLINYTELGYRYHDALTNISGLYPLHSEMIIYVIVDDVMSPRWTGKVSDGKFTDDTYTFIGVDKNNGGNDTLSGEIFGYVEGAPAEYIGEQELIYNDLLISDFKPQTLNKHIILDFFESPNDLHHLSLLDYSGFAGAFSVYWSKFLVEKGPKYTLVFEGSNNLGGISDGDVLTFDNTDFFNIEHVNSNNSNILTLTSVPDLLKDYTVMFRTNPSINLDTDIYDSIAENTATKPTVNVYKHRDLDIDPNNLSNSDYIEIVSDTGIANVEYTVVDDSVILGRQIAVIKEPPTGTKYFSNDVELFNNGEYKTDTDEWYDDIAKSELNLDNTLEDDATFTTIDGANFHYFEVALDDERFNDLDLSLMIRGLYDDDYENWYTGNIFDGGSNVDTASTEMEWSLTEGGPVVIDPNLMTIVDNATDLFSVNPDLFRIKIFKLNQIPEHGGIPAIVSEFVMPNLRDVTFKQKGYFNGLPAWQLRVTNNVVTNIPYFENDVISTYDNCHIQTNASNTVDGNGTFGIVTGNYPETDEEFTVTTGVNKYLIQISGENYTKKEMNFIDGVDDTTQYIGDDMPPIGERLTSPVPNVSFKLNGFSFTSVEELFDNTQPFNYISDDENTNTYPKMIEELVGTKDNIIGRDTWVTGKYIDTPTPRHNLLTKMMKQGFVAGTINRFGNYSFKSFLEDNSGPTHLHDDDIIITDSIGAFTMTPIEKVYNEFNIKWNYSPVLKEYKNELVIKDVKEDFFPPEAGDWTSFVSGIPNYSNAKDYWNLCHIAYLTNKTINKAPSDRTELEWAVDDSENKPLSLGRQTNDVVLDATVDFEVGSTAFLHWDEPLLIGNTVTLMTEGVDDPVVVLLLDIVPDFDDAIRRFEVEILEYTGSPITQLLTFDSGQSTVNVGTNDWISKGEYSALVDTLINYQVTADTIIDFGLSVTMEYFDNTANEGDIIDVQGRYFDDDENELFIVFRVEVDNVTSTPSVNPEDPQGFFSGTIVDIEKYSTDFRPISTEYNPRVASFVTKLSLKDLTGYPWEYLRTMVNWTPYQKYQVNYSLPITADTVKHELMDNVTFSDPIITPNGQVGHGWITKYMLDPKKDLINVQLTFDTSFLITGSIPECDYIVEDQNNVDTITEDQNNVDTISEEYCPYN